MDRVGIGGYFEYDKKEKLISISTFTGKSKYLYKYYYSEDKEEELLNRILENNTWNKIEKNDELELYHLKDLIEPVSQGYFHYFNYDHYNEVYDAYDIEHNYELGGHASQFYVISIIDTERNVIWYFNL